MTQVYTSIPSTIGSNIFIIPQRENVVTKGIFEEEFSMLEKAAMRNNLSEQEAINLIDSIRDKLPMNQ